MSIDNAISKDIQHSLKKHVLFLPDCSLSGSQSITTSKPSWDCTTATSNLFCCSLWFWVWSVTQIDMRKLDGCHNSCLRRICGVFWPMRMTNDVLSHKTKCDSLRVEIKHCCLEWPGHVLRMDSQQTHKVALHWTPPSKRKWVRPRSTCWRTVPSELQEIHLTMWPVREVSGVSW